jgi:hypothetical protein
MIASATEIRFSRPVNIDGSSSYFINVAA